MWNNRDRTEKLLKGEKQSKWNNRDRTEKMLKGEKQSMWNNRDRIEIYSKEKNKVCETIVIGLKNC